MQEELAKIPVHGGQKHLLSVAAQTSKIESRPLRYINISK